MTRRKHILLIILLVLALAPYFIICFFALPYADDFCYAWTSSEPVSFAHRFMRQYIGWSGRYSAHVLLCNHPFTSGHLLYYQLADLLSLSLVLAGLLFFFRQLFRDVRTAVMTAGFVMLFYLCYMPQLADGVYWYTGVCNYELSSAFTMAHLGFVLLSLRHQNWLRPFSIIMAAVMLFAAIGFTELGASLIPAYYLLAAIVFHQNKDDSPEARTQYRIVLSLLSIAVISAAALVLAPGNRVRSSQYHRHYEVLHSVLFASLQTVRFTLRWLLTIPALALSAVLISIAGSVKDRPLFRFDHRIILVMLLFTIYMSALLPYLTTGILGQHRTINYAFFFAIILWCWWLISLSKQYLLHEKNALLWINKNSFALMTASILLMACTASGGRIIRDTLRGNFATYKKEFVLRQDALISHPDMPIRPLRTIPESFLIVDAREDTAYWVNKCMKYSKIRLQ